MPADKWRTAIYSEWIFTGFVDQLTSRTASAAASNMLTRGSIALIVLLIIPESPRWHCERGNDEKARKILTRIHGNVSGFDLDKEYGVLLAEVQDGRRMAAANKEVSILTCLRGVNLVRLRRLQTHASSSYRYRGALTSLSCRSPGCNGLAAR